MNRSLRFIACIYKINMMHFNFMQTQTVALLSFCFSVSMSLSLICTGPGSTAGKTECCVLLGILASHARTWVLWQQFFPIRKPQLPSFWPLMDLSPWTSRNVDPPTQKPRFLLALISWTSCWGGSCCQLMFHQFGGEHVLSENMPLKTFGNTWLGCLYEAG